jgi:hypothetical protein
MQIFRLNYKTKISKLLFLTLTSVALFAQTATTGGISGRLTDAAGASMPNATIELENTATGQRYTATTTPAGDYRFTDLPVGRYRLITRAGQTAAPAQEVQVEIGQVLTVNLTAPSGNASTDALVSGQPASISTTPSNVMKSWNTRYVTYLPRPNFMSKDGYLAGAYNLSYYAEGLNSASLGVGRGPAVSGNLPIGNNFHIDGIDNNSKSNPGPLLYVSNEATQEFALFHNQPSPYFSHSTGGKFNSIIQTGANRWHGSFYNYLQNRELNAIDAATKRAGYDDNPRYDQNRLGASLGGAIVPSKFFVFGNFEYIPLGFQRVLGGAAFAPTGAGFTSLQGLSGINATNLGILRNALGGNVGDASTSVTVGGTQIPFGQVNALARGWQNQFAGTGAADWTITDKDQLRVRYVHNELENTNPFSTLDGFANRWRMKNFLASAAHYHTFGNAVTNELRVGYNRNTSSLQPNGQTVNGFALGNIQIGGDAGLSLGAPFGFNDSAQLSTWQVSDNVGFRWGRNELRIGYDGRRYNGYIGNSTAAFGNYGYSSLERFLRDQSPDVVNQRAFGTNNYDAGQWLHLVYLQDRFTVAQNLSFDLGVRWNYVTRPTQIRRQAGLSNLNAPGILEFGEPSFDNNLWSPYAGMAWNPYTNTVVRASFGMEYNTLYSGVQGAFGQFANVATGNLTGTSSNFLGTGGLQNPITGANPTLAQQRSLVNAYYGNQRMPYAMHWNVGVQQGAWNGFNIEVKYLGNRGLNLPIYSLLGGAALSATNSLPLYNTRPTQAQLNALPLTLNNLQQQNQLAGLGFTSPINTIDFAGKSWYHAGTVDIMQRFGGGFQMFGNYTYSHLRDNATGTPFDLNFAGNRDYDTSLYDRRHRANLTALFEVAPLFRDTTSWLRNIFADFNLSGTYVYESNQWAPVYGGTNAGLNGLGVGGAFYNPSGTAGVGSGVTPLSNAGGQTVAYLVNNPNAQFISGGAGTFGNVRRNAISLGDVHNLDVAAVKRFNYREFLSFELRGEAYNILNRSNFTANPVNTIGSPLIGAKFYTPNSLGFGDLRGSYGNNARILQVALRLAF